MIKDILLLQKRELEARLKEPYVEREVDSKRLKSPLIKVIMGPRRAGKSFFAVHFLNAQGSFGYVNFDDEKLVEIKDYDEIVAALNSIYGNPKRVLFDEIQNLPKWELFANRLQRQGYDLILTGSNAKLLGMDLATHLTGRHTVVHILPFSFKEFLSFEKKELAAQETKERLSDYLTYGGYPEPFLKRLDYADYLSTLFSSILFKDVIKRHKIRFVQGLEELALYLVSNVANECSYTSLSRTTRCKSAHTVEKYVGYLEEVFLFFTVRRFSFKVKEQVSSNKKIYCFDNGFVHAKAFKATPDIGKLYENAVAIELKKAELNGRISVYYWKNVQQEEVDFVVKKGLKIEQLVQVCYDVGNPETKKREVRALLKAGKDLNCDNLLIITGGYEAEESVEWFGASGKITFIPLWKWLLAQ